MTEYLDFVLLIERVVRNHRARVLASPEGEAEVEFRWPSPRRNVRVVEDPKGAGSLLFETIFRGPVKDRLIGSLSTAKAVGKGLRLRLRFADSALVAHPWELLYDAEHGRFLALEPTSPIVRYLEVAEEIVPLRLPSPIRIVVLAACPAGFALLDAEQEQNELRQALSELIACNQVVVDVVPRPTVSSLHQHLQGCHILHFIGHGDFDQNGALVFEDDAGRPRRVEASEMADLIAAHPSVRLVFLNACHGGHASGEDVFGGVAQSLLRRGVPAVVAMRDEVEDEVALLFSRVFYSSLAKGDPVEAATTRGRQAIRHAGHGFAWSSPVLYLRAPDGVIGLGSRERNRWARLSSWPKRTTSRIKSIGRVSWLKLCAAFAGLSLIAYIVYVVALALDPCPSPAGLDLKFAYIRPGTFRMGSERNGNGPPHDVTLTQPFCLGVEEVRQRHWQAVEGSNPSATKGDELPVENVSWSDARSFVEELSRREPLAKFFLPTEAQWEYAASGGGEGPSGDDGQYGNCASDQVMPVGSFHATRWGLHDMGGNVYEWVDDVSPYGREPVTDPVGNGRRQDNLQVRRGGSFHSKTLDCLATTRTFTDRNEKDYDTGFRIAREPVRRSLAQVFSSLLRRRAA
ncbi:MAG TPA: CHAT domain-containing protein [Thermoanaerobaculia bacterium]|nr:CHAT domain-containing protein [Thermoanaerobaculia bacterium]